MRSPEMYSALVFCLALVLIAGNLEAAQHSVTWKNGGPPTSPGNALAVQKAISSARKYTEGLDRMPAMQNNKFYALAGYIDASVIEYQEILGLWANALKDE